MADRAVTEASLDELFDLALGSDDESEEYWLAVCELHRRGDPATFQRARASTLEADEAARILGVNILAQLGYAEGRPFLKESLPLVENLASGQQSARVVDSAITALGHLKDTSSVPVVLAQLGHPDADVRHAVAMTLPNISGDPPTRSALDAFFALMEDEDADVRNWATFGLGTLLEVDTTEVRDALFARIEDRGADGVVAGEALHGLARRHDPRVLAPLLRRLEMRDPGPRDLVMEFGDLVISAAYELADARCLPALYALRAEWDEAGPALDAAIEACERSTQGR